MSQYQVCLLLAAATSLALLVGPGRKRWTIGVAAICGATVGGKAVSIVLHGFSISAGWSLDGGIVGAVFAVLLAGERDLDCLTLPFCLGLIVARIGCLLTGCCDGLPTEVPWGWVRAGEAVAFGVASPRHPSPAYEMAAVLLSMVLARRAGRRFLGTMSLFMAMRVGLWSLRADVSPMSVASSATLAALFFVLHEWPLRIARTPLRLHTD